MKSYNGGFTADRFSEELKSGPYAWPGGYQRYFVFSDGGSCCFKCAEKERLRIRGVIREKATKRGSSEDSGFRIVAADINWEDPSLYCDHCSERIPSAYAEDETECAL